MTYSQVLSYLKFFLYFHIELSYPLVLKIILKIKLECISFGFEALGHIEFGHFTFVTNFGVVNILYWHLNPLVIDAFAPKPF